MTTARQVRKSATALPEVVESSGREQTVYSVCGTPFVRVDAAGRADFELPQGRSQAAIADHPEAVPLVRRGEEVGVSILLSDLNGMNVNALVRAAWEYRAPGAWPPRPRLPASTSCRPSGRRRLGRSSKRG